MNQKTNKTNNKAVFIAMGIIVIFSLVWYSRSGGGTATEGAAVQEQTVPQEAAAGNVPLVVIIIFGAVGLLFAVIGIGFIVSFLRTRSIINNAEFDFNIKTVNARIIDYKVERRRSNKRSMLYYYPVYEYKQDWEMKTYTSSSSSTMRKNIGTEVTLYIDKDGKIYERGENNGKIFIGIIFTFLGLLFAGLSAVFIFPQLFSR